MIVVEYEYKVNNMCDIKNNTQNDLKHILESKFEIFKNMEQQNVKQKNKNKNKNKK